MLQARSIADSKLLVVLAAVGVTGHANLHPDGHFRGLDRILGHYEGIVNLLDLPFPGHLAPPESARKSGVSILLFSFFQAEFRSR